jgi:hypothetical protein
MSNMKHTPKRKRRSKALPVLGAAGLSLSLASGASAAPIGPADIATVQPGENHDLTFGEEEISGRVTGQSVTERADHGTPACKTVESAA